MSAQLANIKGLNVSLASSAVLIIIGLVIAFIFMKDRSKSDDELEEVV